MRYVLDSGVAFKCLVPEAHTDKAIRLRDDYRAGVHELLAPDVFPFGWVDLGAMLRPQEKVCGYATTFVRDAARAVLGSTLLPSRYFDTYRARTDSLANLIDARFAALEPVTRIRLHGDCHAGNVLWTDSGPHFVDLDDARMGPAVQDLWMLAPSPRALDALLEGYGEFRDFDFRELSLVEPLRIMRQVHWAGWVAARWDDPAFPRAFPQVGEARWWEQHLTDLAEAESTLLDD